MTFGLFSGFSAVFGLLINNQFGRESSLALPVLGATFAFLSPLIGSIIRMSWGIFCDRMGGAIWTFISGVGMAITLAGIAWVLYNPHRLDRLLHLHGAHAHHVPVLRLR